MLILPQSALIMRQLIHKTFGLLLEGACKLSRNISQVSYFDGKIFTLLHGSTSTQGENYFSGQPSNSMVPLMVSNLKNSHICFTVFAMCLSALNLGAKKLIFWGSRYGSFFFFICYCHMTLMELSDWLIYS